MTEVIARRHRGSLRARLTGAVMVPLAALVLFFGGITLWVTHDTEANTVDRVLVGSVRTLSLAYTSPPAVHDRIVALTVKLLRRRARPKVEFSVYLGRRLVAGDARLLPPADYDPHWDGRLDRHVPATFVNSYRDTRLVRGYLDAADAQGVTQAAYLRDASVGGRPVRIATEYRQVPGYAGVLAIQVADFIDDRAAYESGIFVKVVLCAAAVLLVSAVLVWAALSWGLRPLGQLARQIEAVGKDGAPTLRLTLPDSAPREAVPYVSAFNGLMVRLEAATRSLREFTSNASHQMRTPLAIARVHADVLQRYGADTPEGRAALHDIPQAIDALEQLLRQLISLSRSEESVDRLCEPFDLAQVAKDVTAAAAARAPDHIDIGYEAGAQGALVALGEPLMAAELLGNLVDNAIRYNRPGGSVSVEIGRDGGRAVVRVIDDGPGIPEAERERVWQRFHRVQGRGGPSGSGLGLPIVRSLAERMDAEVSLAPGRGGIGVQAAVRFAAA